MLISELQSLKIGWGTIYQELTRLEREGALRVVRVGGRTFLYPRGDGDLTLTAERDAILRGSTALRIARVICEGVADDVVAIAARARTSKRAAYHHIRRMLDSGLVTAPAPQRLQGLMPTRELIERLRVRASD